MNNTEKHQALYEEYRKSQALIRALQDKVTALMAKDSKAYFEAEALIEGLSGTLKSEEAIAAMEGEN